jgi:hypothetical protein
VSTSQWLQKKIRRNTRHKRLSEGIFRVTSGFLMVFSCSQLPVWGVFIKFSSIFWKFIFKQAKTTFFNKAAEYSENHNRKYRKHTF